MTLTSCFQKARQALKLTLFSLSGLVAVPALAIPVTVEYSGVVSRLSYADCQNLVNGSCNSWNFTSASSSDFVEGKNVEVGSAFVGGFTYESTAPLTAMSSDGFQAIHLDSVYGAHFQSDEVSLPASSFPAVVGSFSVVNDRPISTYLFDSFYVSSWFSQGDWFSSLNFHLQDRHGVALNSFEVPLSLDFSAFNSNVFNIGFLRRSDGDQLQLYGDLTSVTFSSASTVPEPGTWALLLVGLAAVAATFRRASRSAGSGSPRPLAVA